MHLFKTYSINFSLLIFVCSFISFCQNRVYNEIGQHFIKYYSPKEYNESYQNWCVNQDKRGIMYFGNSNGILEYDGSSWRSIKIPNNSIVRSMAIGENGRIYVAASSDFGYLAPDSLGQNRFISILNYLDDRYKEFGDVWDVVTTSHGVYFKTQDKIFRWNGDRIKVFESVNAYRLYKVRDNVYVRNGGEGLLKISDNSLNLVPDGEKFASIGIYDMLPFGNEILVTTNSNGLFLYDGYSFSPFNTEADAFLKQNRIYNACELKDGNFAFATQRGGVAIIDKEGHFLKLISTKNGLHSDVIYDVFPDQQEGLWLAMEDGISRVEIPSSFTLIPKNDIYNGNINSLYRFQGRLYAANTFGLFYFDESSSKFKMIPSGNSSGNGFFSIGNSLFAATLNSICKIKNTKVVKDLLDFSAPVFNNSKIDSNIIYVTYRIGLAILKYNNGSLKLLKRIPIVSDEVEYLVEDSDGSLWIKTYYGGVVHLKSNNKNLFSTSENNQVIMDRYNKQNGLPGERCSIISVSGKTLFATDVGLFRFNSESESFVPDSSFGKSFATPSNSILSCVKTRNNDLWILADTKDGKELGKAIKQKDGKYDWQPNSVFRRLDLSTVFAFYADYDPQDNADYLWISTDQGLIRYDPGIKQIYKKGFSTIIRSVVVNQDSFIYKGTANDSLKKNNILSFANNNIVFHFSAVSYDRSESNCFQYYLEGYDDEWSQWSSERTKEYTNLSGGNYTFHVRSKNVYRVPGNEDSFSFSILSPWYLSWWSYSIYAIIFLGLLYQIRRYELKRLNKKHALELELVEYKKLKELDQLKSQFFANISHEFRTPLTLILGQIESVMSSAVETKEKGKLQVANRNARRLLTLINQLLDLSKLEAGSMELKAEQHNIVSFLKSLFYSFESLAESQKISLKFESEYENIPVVFDPDKMEKVFYNLVSNAFKFTSANGEIRVNLNIINTTVEIRVKDTGRGIAAERLSHIFDRFYQVDGSSTREHEGTGIGLALTKELIELHKGKITVNSKEGEGSEFIIQLPLGDLKTEKEQLVKLADNIKYSLESFDEIENVELNLVSGDREIILIVEDNSDVRSYIKEQLGSDYSTIGASNGEEGILEAQKKIPDLIITDVMMPKMDGYRFSREIRNNEKTSHIPIVMLTAKAGLDDKIEGLETGIDAYLTKPFSAKELKVRVKNLIYQRKQLRKRFSKSTVIKPAEVSAVSADQKFLEKTINIIETNFGDEQFSVEKLAEKVNMSVSQLNRKLNALIDQPSGQLIRSLRLQHAADLLQQNSGTVAEICYKAGFNDQAYFSRAFKKQFGRSPSEFKKDR